MKFAKWTFLIAGIYGVLIITPMLFMEDLISKTNPPAITHSENYYGFLIAVLAWQLVFLLISRDPLRYRAIMPIAALVEKFAYSAVALGLVLQGRASAAIAVTASIDIVLGMLFLIAFAKTREAHAGLGKTSARTMPTTSA